MNTEICLGEIYSRRAIGTGSIYLLYQGTSENILLSFSEQLQPGGPGALQRYKKDNLFDSELLRPLAIFPDKLHRWARMPFRCGQPYL